MGEVVQDIIDEGGRPNALNWRGRHETVHDQFHNIYTKKSMLQEDLQNSPSEYLEESLAEFDDLILPVQVAAFSYVAAAQARPVCLTAVKEWMKIGLGGKQALLV